MTSSLFSTSDLYGVAPGAFLRTAQTYEFLVTAIVDIVISSYLPFLSDNYTIAGSVSNYQTSPAAACPDQCFATMDPLSMTASIVAVLQLTTTLTSYIHSVKHATAEQAQFAVETFNLCSLLTSLRYRVETVRSNDPWFIQVRMLGIHNGPLDQFKDVLERMVEKISSSRKRDQIKSALMWKFTKSEVETALERMERLKSLINCSLSGDLL